MRSKQALSLTAALIALSCSYGWGQQAPGAIHVEAPPAVDQLVQQHVSYNTRHPTIDGYRIRIYRDNSPDARQHSLEISNAFSELLQEVPAYRSYDNPYFKVSVGDFRTKNDALKLFSRIKRMYPKAYIVAEPINMPTL
jgi:hypothetical protein